MENQKKLNEEQKKGWNLVVKILIYALTVLGSFLTGQNL